MKASEQSGLLQQDRIRLHFKMHISHLMTWRNQSKLCVIKMTDAAVWLSSGCSCGDADTRRQIGFHHILQSLLFPPHHSHDIFHTLLLEIVSLNICSIHITDSQRQRREFRRWVSSSQHQFRRFFCNVWLDQSKSIFTVVIFFSHFPFWNSTNIKNKTFS